MVTVDAIVYSIAPAGGIAVQFNELLKRLPVHGITFEAYRFCREGLNFPTLVLPPRRLERYRRFAHPGAGELFHSTYYRLPSRRHRSVVTTVHDFIYERYAGGPRRWVHSWQKYEAIRASDVLVCVSEQTKQDLLQFLPEVKAKTIVVIPNGVGDDYRLIDQQRNDEEFILFVGGRGGYKNFTQAVLACAGLKDLSLYIVGGGPPVEKERHLLETHLAGRYKWLGWLSNGELNRHYNHAVCLLYPSSFEGFGIPLVEAMAAGCPVVAVNASAMREVAHEAALLVDAPEPRLLAVAIEETRKPAARQSLIAAGISRARRYSWSSFGERMAELYRLSLAG